MLKHIQAIQMLLETSVFLCNIDRFTDKHRWDMRMCSLILANTSSTLYGVLQHLAGASLNDSNTQLCVLLLQQTLIPFQMKWDQVLFKNGKPRRWVRRKYRDELQEDFLEIQEVVQGVCDTLGASQKAKADKGIA